ncbi:hypothetical protein [Stackebrandtia soli]|uniref:hypothetical protein n=1 Tax=Stackebrandtia soli TaxID=1892856 RepID=UPI0039ECF4C8
MTGVNLTALEACDEMTHALQRIKDAMGYIPHRFGPLRREHEDMVAKLTKITTFVSEFNTLFTGEPAKAKKKVKDAHAMNKTCGRSKKHGH